ncbi:F-box protein SKIP17-like isoform X2 [Populus nigra]|uniref:F-box protein SKIP17-like isoform X2 n=1 Tax=Populus nigra TaxID=3691 RepID=UPI002B265799|nr:F-box protein SKIP17-like isoform X2 [Populus nigra]
MDLLHTPTSMAKRPCPFPSSPSSPPPNPNKLPNMNNQVGNLLQTFLNLADSHSLSIDQSLEHLLDSSPCDADQSLLIDRALKLGSLLLEAGNRSARKRSSVHNSLTWALPPDLTIKLFSMLDAQSLCYAAATCSMFYKCAMDPLCYANIDLTTVVPKVNNAVVSTMIQRAGKALRHVDLRQTLVSVSLNCPLIERLFFESSKTGRDDSLKSSTCVDLVNNCPNLTSLALRGFKLYDYKLRILVKGFCKLKYVDFSTSYSITGSFLRNLGGDMGGSLLEVLIFRDCMHLKELEVARLFASVLAGDFRFLRYLDISNREGLAAAGDSYGRCYSLSIIPTKQVLEERPDICLLAEFPSEGSFVDLGQMTDSDLTSEVSLSSQLSSRASDGLSFMCTSEINYSSDQTSGNEEG